MADVLRALNDEQISWLRRVKLAQYAWASDDVLIPNKRQILMNSLVSAVSASRRYQHWLLNQVTVMHINLQFSLKLYGVKDFNLKLTQFKFRLKMYTFGKCKLA